MGITGKNSVRLLRIRWTNLNQLQAAVSLEVKSFRVRLEPETSG